MSQNPDKTTIVIAEVIDHVITRMVILLTGFGHIITMDLHQKEVQGFFNCPVDNLRASNFLIQYIRESVISR